MHANFLMRTRYSSPKLKSGDFLNISFLKAPSLPDFLFELILNWKFSLSKDDRKRVELLD